MALNNNFKNKIKTEVKRYNDRIRYYQKKGYTVPATTTYSEISAFYGDNRTAIERRLRQLKDYTYRSAKETVRVGKYNANINRYNYDKYKENQEFASKALTQQIKLAKLRDKSKGYTLPSEYTRELMARKKTIQQGLSSKATKKQIEAAIKQTNYYTENRIRTDEQFYTNFLAMYKEQMDLAKVPKNIQNKIEENFRSLEPDELLDLMENEPDVKNVLMWYKVTKATGGINLTQKIRKGKTEADLEKSKFVELSNLLPTLTKKYRIK